MVDMCRNEDGEFSARSKEYLHKTSLFLVYVGQYSDRRAQRKSGHEQNAINEGLVSRDKIISSLLHIKSGLMKHFVEALNKEVECFKYICKSFPRLSAEKLEAGVFDGPDIRKLIKDSDFVNSMDDLEKHTWCSFVDVVKKFLGNNRAVSYKELIEKMLK